MPHRSKISLVVVALLVSTLACSTYLGAPPAEPTIVPSPVISETPVIRLSSAESIITQTPVIEPVITETPLINDLVACDKTCLDVCLIKLNDIMSSKNIDPIGGNYAGADVAFKLVNYVVKDGQIGKPQILYSPTEFKAYQEDFAAHQRIWNYASFILPSKQFKWIVKYKIFSSSSNKTAWVSNELEDHSKWTLGVDIQHAEDPTSLTYTLIYEFGHLITLNSEQIPSDASYYSWSQNAVTCKQFAGPAGCTNPDSYMNLFYQTFWVDILDEWHDAVGEADTISRDELFVLVREFHKKHKSEFVSRYAATNIHEDMAESFTSFVLEPKPAGNNTGEKKVLFFYDFPELVAIRSLMIQNICSYSQK